MQLLWELIADLFTLLNLAVLAPLLRATGLLGVSVAVLGVLVRPSICTNGKEKAYMAAMKSDLRNLVTAQELHRDEFGHFATSFAEDRYRHSSGVVLTAVEILPGGAGFRAEAAYPSGTRKRCRIELRGTEVAEPSCDR